MAMSFKGSPAQDCLRQNKILRNPELMTTVKRD